MGGRKGSLGGTLFAATLAAVVSLAGFGCGVKTRTDGRAASGAKTGTEGGAGSGAKSSMERMDTAAQSGRKDTASQRGWTRTDSRIRIRLYNLDSLPLENVFVQWPVDSARFPSLPAQGYTEYVAVEKAYRYAFIKAQAGALTWICQPVDFVGETLLGPGRYTYEISRAGVMEESSTGFLRLEMREDKEGS